MPVQGLAAIVGTAQYRPQRRQDAPRAFPLDQVAELGGMAMADAGLTPEQIDGLAVTSVGFTEVRMFVPAMVGEYLGLKLNYGEVVDLGGACAVGMAWRAAAAIEMGLCKAVLCVLQARPAPPDPTTQARPASAGAALGATSGALRRAGGRVRRALRPRRPEHRLRDDRPALQGASTATTSGPWPRSPPTSAPTPAPTLTPSSTASRSASTTCWRADDRRPAAPAWRSSCPCMGGAAFIVARKDIERSNANRPAVIRGFGEHIQCKSPSYADDMIVTPIGPASRAPSRWPACSRPTWTWPRSTTATPSPCC